MNIVFLSRRFYPDIGGVEKHTFEVGKRLLKKGHVVTVITEKTEKAQGNFEKKSRIKIFRIAVGKDEPGKKFEIWKRLWKLKDIFIQADIVHAHDVFFWYLPFRFLFPQKKVFITFHGFEGTFPVSKKAIVVRKVSEWLSFGNICIGDYIKKWYYTKPDYVTYGGVETHNKNRDSEKKFKKIKIALIGRLDDDMGISYYINAIKLLKKQKIHFSFDIYGEGRYAKTIKKYGSYHGTVKNMKSIVEKYDIFFSCSYLTMLELLAHKKTVIAVYQNPLKKDYLKNSPFERFIFICKNESEITQAMLSIYQNPWKSETMTRNGQKWANTQTWDKVTRMYLKLWEKN